MHVTLRGRRDLPSLRRHVFGAVRDAIAKASRDAFRVVHFSVQRDHVHLIVEGADRARVIRGIQGLVIRVALAVNRAAQRRGTVWDDRYHARELRSPREVRNAIAYVLLNWKKHSRDARVAIDGCSSGPWFDGWRGLAPSRTEGAPVVAAHTWLVRVGWRRHGLLRGDEAASRALRTEGVRY